MFCLALEQISDFFAGPLLIYFLSSISRYLSNGKIHRKTVLRKSSIPRCKLVIIIISLVFILSQCLNLESLEVNFIENKIEEGFKNKLDVFRTLINSSLVSYYQTISIGYTIALGCQLQTCRTSR